MYHSKDKQEGEQLPPQMDQDTAVREHVKKIVRKLKNRKSLTKFRLTSFDILVMSDSQIEGHTP